MGQTKEEHTDLDNCYRLLTEALTPHEDVNDELENERQAGALEDSPTESLQKIDLTNVLAATPPAE